MAEGKDKEEYKTDIKTGTCGPELTWTYDPETGHLQIEGKGPMYDYMGFRSPWYNLHVFSVTFPEGLTSIGAHSMTDGEFVSVKIPDSVLHIGKGAFACSCIQEISLGTSVRVVEEGAFLSCINLKTLVIPDSVRFIKTSAFACCGSLERVEIPDSVESVGVLAFDYCSKLKEVRFGKGLTELDCTAFLNCYELESVTVDGSNPYYSSIDGVLFSRDGPSICLYPPGRACDTYKIPDSVVSISDRAFSSAKVSHVVIPDSVVYIEREAFEHSHILELNIPRNDQSFDTAWNTGCCCREINVHPEHNELSSEDGILYSKGGSMLIRYPCGRNSPYFDIPARVKEIAKEAFDGCSRLREIRAYGPIKGLSSLRLEDCPAVILRTDKHEITGQRYNRETGCLYILGDSYGDIIYREEYPDLQKVYFCGVSMIRDNAFEGCGNITALDATEDLTWIGDRAFADCEKLVEPPSDLSLEFLGEGAFSGCSSLEWVLIPGSLRTIPREAFSRCTSLEFTRIGEGVEMIGPQAFAHCTSLTSVKLPASVSVIADDAFTGCTRLERIDVEPENEVCRSVNGVLFDYRVTYLVRYPPNRDGREYTVPETVETISNYVFEDCRKLEVVHIGPSVCCISNCAFIGSPSITEIDVSPENPKYVSWDGVLFTRGGKHLVAYPSGKGGSSYAVPDGVTDIDDFSFMRNESLSEIVLPRTLKSIGEEAFRDCIALQEMVIPASVRSVDMRAFYGCRNLVTLVIANPDAEIDDTAFISCSSLQTVYVGDLTDLERISFIRESIGHEVEFRDISEYVPQKADETNI